MAAHLLHAEAGTAKEGPAVPISGGVAGVGAKVQAFALHSTARITGALVVQGCMVTMGQAVSKGALDGTDDAAVMVGVAIAAVVLVSVACKGDDNVAPYVVLGLAERQLSLRRYGGSISCSGCSSLRCGTTPAARTGRGNVIAKAA